MASAMASAATRNIPSPYTISAGPRVRPPRLLPGTKAANTNPQPNELPPVAGHVWVQGKWRNPGSNAARDRREVQSARTEKALRHATHGMNIYAYRHIRTNQVVYSLTRVMQNNKILPQLLYHGKKTVPSALRRDLWRPFFSMHFSENPAGTRAGLEAYRRLRELSAQRQLDPPEELITATEEDVKRVKLKHSPMDLKRKMKSNSVRYLPIKNQLLPLKLRAERLMDQKASSVADAAFVLGLMNQELSPAEELEAAKDKNAARLQKWSSRALQRLEKIREQEKTKEAHLETRKEAVQPNQGQLGLTPHSARRIALEHGGSVVAAQKGAEYMVQDLESLARQRENINQYLASVADSPSLLENEQRPTDLDAKKFKLEYIKVWKEQHGDASEGPSSEDIAAAVKRERRKIRTEIEHYDQRIAEARANIPQEQKEFNDSTRIVRVLWADIRDATWAQTWTNNVQHGELETRAALKHSLTLQQENVIDEDGNLVSEQPKRIVIQASTTPHVFGNDTDSKWYQTPEQIEQRRQDQRGEEMKEWTDKKFAQSREIFLRIDALQQTKDQSSRGSDLSEMEANYPSIFDKVQEFQEWRNGHQIYADLLTIKDQVLNLKPAYDDQDITASKRLHQIDLQLAAYEENFPEYLSNIAESETDLTASIAERQERIFHLEKQISDLEDLPSESQSMHTILDFKEELERETRFISTKRDTAWHDRLFAIERILQDLDSNAQDKGIMDLLTQRVNAEQQGDQESLASIDSEMKQLEDDKISQLLGIEKEVPVEAKITMMDKNAREKGVEEPPPQKRGIFKRLFGR